MPNQILDYTDANYDLVIKKDRDLNAVITAQVDVNGLLVDFDFSAYTASTLTVRTKPDAQYAILTFSTTDGSIVLPVSGGTFQLKKSAIDLQYTRAGNYVYDMWISSPVAIKKCFLSGNFIIESNISD